MIDINELRVNPDKSIQSLESRGESYYQTVTNIVNLDTKRRKTIAKLDILKATRNQVSKQIGLAKTKGEFGGGDTANLIAEMRSLGLHISKMEKQLSLYDQTILNARLSLPNFPTSISVVSMHGTTNTGI